MEKLDQEILLSSLVDGEATEVLRVIVGKVNELIDALSSEKEAHGVTMEKIGSLEGEIDKIRKQAETTDRALAKTIQNLALHTHSELGQASVPLAV